MAGNELVRRGVEAVLRGIGQISAVRRCATSGELAALVAAPERLDAVVVAADDIDWLEPVHPTLASDGTCVLVILDHTALADPHRYTTYPVDGFLSQEHLTTDGLLDTLHRCRRGELPIPPDLARVLLARADPSATRPRGGVASLTSRERQALALLVKGLSNKQIARELAISSHGAKRLVASVMLKLDTPNRTSAAVVAIRAGLLDEHHQAGIPT